MQTGDITAGKIVPKSLLTKSHQKEKMSQEIRLHKAVAHDCCSKNTIFTSVIQVSAL